MPPIDAEAYLHQHDGQCAPPIGKLAILPVMLSLTANAALLVSFAFAQAPIRGVPTKVHMSACVLGSNDNYLSLHHLSCEYARSHAVRT